MVWPGGWEVIGAIGLGAYYVWRLKPKQSPLHKRNRKRAKRLLKRLQSKSTDYQPGQIFSFLRHQDFFVFEELLLCCFERRGFRIKRNHAYTGDGGIDGTFFDKKGNKFLIQAKRYKSAINPQHISEFNNVVKREKAAGGFFIHTGRTGPKSYQALAPTVRIISGNKLLVLLGVKLSKTDESCYT